MRDAEGSTDTPGVGVLGSEETRSLLGNPRRLGPGRLLVSEVFGPTVQGEGEHVGRAAMFVRLGGCPLECSWCDTDYSWRPDLVGDDNTFEVLPVGDVADRVLAGGCPRVVVTGGEPLLQRDAAASLGEVLARSGVAMEVETAGVVAPGPLAAVVDLFTVSPKLANSGMPVERRLRWSVLAEFAVLASVFKFVVTDIDQLSEVEDVVLRLDLPPDRVLVMPEGRCPEVVLERARALVSEVTSRGWGLTPRWHVLLWRDERGR
jgi:7-carboxy-7-deazaguanine synthase